MQEDKWIFIVNPTAGNGFAGTLVGEIEKMIPEHHAEGEVVLTKYPGHASELAGEYHARGFSNIIGVGGDGTINEIAQTLAGVENVTLGVVPAGSGNDFIQILGFPGRFGKKEWDTLFRRNTIRMDAGRVNGKIFLNGMGLGFDAQVASENYIEPGVLKKGGSRKYLWHIIKNLFFFRERQMVISNDGITSETDCFINTVSIGRRFAGGFLLTPEAIANDSLLDVCAIRRLNLFQRFRLLLKVPAGKHIFDKRVSYYRTAGLRIGFTDEVPFHIDGELFYAKTFDIDILAEAFNLIYNPEGNHFFRKAE
ncbi:MAG TPA: YegS/Rv2252/BmrU family lipid kinase [Bacteroidales bacterium]|jgi:YegS/Rv2252/BmrU family lipid kinase|nr:YegS/Rv2252/BmrU family lipid kinase [Bacteroidales bacterium]HNR41708.1 YegS/Rv2252/BmrU family lipid kinase [Bacteroidales bacterium]HPM19357.1 YegS/Rv2252/BmrU family lipid kinase [Bacteroidales bacterium]HQG78541.1 YegS/Rv2252/BmrU family lipid kinase [Bacteroidales bacterium]